MTAKEFVASDGTKFTSRKAWKKYEFELSFAFRNKKGEKLDKPAGSIGGQPFDMSDLDECEVVLTDNTDQVQADVLTKCRVFIGASAESVFIRNCSDCVFFVACKQLRTRDCQRCTFYLHCKTEPVIEASSELCFAPFMGGYPGQAEHFKAANLDPEMNFWWGVFDFSNPDKTGPGTNWIYVADSDKEQPWFPRGHSDQIAKATVPGSTPLPSQSGGNFSFGNTMSFTFDTSQEQAELAHLQMEQQKQPPPCAPDPIQPSAPPDSSHALPTLPPPQPPDASKALPEGQGVALEAPAE